MKKSLSPPLPRQNAKVTPPSPPKIITDKTRTLEFMRVGMLGEVSARCFEPCSEDTRNIGLHGCMARS